jgi:hypothetical protein
MRYVSWFMAVGAAVPLGGFALSLLIPVFPSPLLSTLLVLCPGYILLMSTAGCEPFDACTMGVLAQVVASNVILYGIVGAIVGYVRRGKQRVAHQ